MAFIPQNFKDAIGPPLKSAWLNALDTTVNFVLNGAQTVAQALAALGLPAGGIPTPMTTALGGTGTITGNNLLFAGTDSGVVNAYVVAAAGLAAPVVGTQIRFTPGTVNTGPSTLAGGTGTAQPVTNWFGAALTGGEINGATIVEWTGAAWQLIASACPPGNQKTPAELAAGVTPVNYQYPPGNMLRYGIVANSSGAMTANTAIFVALVNASIANGPTGLLYFPNTTGADVYYLGSGAAAQLRDGIVLDLGGCTLNFSGSYNASLNTFGFMNFIRNVTVQNGLIVVNYNGSSGSNNGAALRIGSRSGYAFGTYSSGIFDQDTLAANSLPLMGNIQLLNLRISSNNPGVQTILLFGGLRNVLIEDVWLDGASVVPGGIYYEYGWSSTNSNPGTPSLWSSSHAQNMVWRNIHATNHLTGGNNVAVGANGAHNLLLENIHCDTADIGVAVGSGEAFYLRPWAQDGVVGVPRLVTMRGIFSQNTAVAGIQAIGAQVLGAGSYLHPYFVGLTTAQQYQAQTDYLSFIIDGFELFNDSGIQANGSNVDIRNGFIYGTGAAASAGIFCNAECIHLNVQNVKVVGINGIGIRADGTSPIWSPGRPKFVRIADSKVISCTSTGIDLNLTQAAIIENNQIGANTLYDVAGEAVMTVGILGGSTTLGLICRDNYTSISGSTYSYQLVTQQGVIQNERNAGYTTNGNWVQQTPQLTVTGWGTPVGAAIVNNYNITDAGGANSNTNKVVAYVVTILKANGLMGA